MPKINSDVLVIERSLTTEEIRKNGLVYFEPYWEVELEEYVKKFPKCDAFTLDVEHSDKIRIYVCAETMESNEKLLNLYKTGNVYNQYEFLNVSSAFKFGRFVVFFKVVKHEIKYYVRPIFEHMP